LRNFLCTRNSRNRIAAVVLPLAVLNIGFTPAAAREAGAKILFENRFQLFLIDPATNGVTDLGVRGGTYDWSPDGARIAFVKNPYAQRGRPSELWVMNADGSGLRRLARGLNKAARPEWSRDGSWLAFTNSDPPRQVSQLYVIRPDGSGLRRIVRGIQPSVPRWSPDGKRILYLNRVRQVRSVFVVDVKTARSRRLVHRVDYGGIAWSPKGASISYVQRRRLYVAAANGTRRRRVANLVVWGVHSWSPDGSVIAVEHHQGPSDNRRSDIYLVRADGRGVKRMTHGSDRNAEDLASDWSADGTKLSFTSDRDLAPGGPRELYVMNADGTCETRLTHGAYALDRPAWQPGRSSGPPLLCASALR
jgi:Tol biopolymer transport system component